MTTALSLAVPAGAAARWGPGNACGYPVGYHCYALESWHMAGYPREYVDGNVLYVNTKVSEVPGWGNNDFVTDEMWVGFGGRSWIETGQLTGSAGRGCCTMHRFWEYWVANQEQAEVIDPTEAAKNTYNHYEIYDPCHCGSWGIWWNGANPAYEGTQVAQIGVAGGQTIFPAWAPELENGMETAAETHPWNWARTMVAAVVPPSDVWTEWISGYGVHSHQVNSPGQCVYRNPESGHWGNVEVSTCDCKKQCSEGLSVIAPSPLEQPIYLPSGVGSTVSAESAAEIADNQARLVGDENPTSFTQMKGSFASTQALLHTGVTIPASTETRAWLESESYLTVMRGRFTATPTRPGSTSFIATIMAVIIDAHTGEVEARYIGEIAPSSSALQAVPTPNRRAPAKISMVTRSGTVRGLLQRKGKALKHWRIFGQALATSPSGSLPIDRPPQPVTRTGQHGRFVVSLQPGKYRLFGVWPSGTFCPGKTVTVSAGRESHIKLLCDAPTSG